MTPGVSPATAGRHLSILEASLLIRRLPLFFANIGKRMVKSPKLYWSADDATPMERWIALNPGHGPGVVLHAGTDYRRLSQNVRAIPVSMLFG